MKDKTGKYQKEDLPDGWNEELEKVYDMEMGKYLSDFTNYKPTRQEVIDRTKSEFIRLQKILQNIK